jgi:ribonuclease BN (tRNA processing enzyme)
LTCSDSGRKEISFYGPVGLIPFWQSTGSFTFRPQFITNVVEIPGYCCTDMGPFSMHCLPLSRDNDASFTSHVCYVVETKVLPGKFDVARAKARGVPVGPLFGALQKGNAITLPDGTTVRPEDVLGPSEAPRYAAIICNVATAGDSVSQNVFINCLVSHPFWDRY